MTTSAFSLGWDAVSDEFSVLARLPQRTLYWLGCWAADGATNEADARAWIYSVFENSVYYEDPILRWDGKELTYWMNGNAGAITTANLLKRADGNGNCQAWSGLFRDMLLVQGIEANRVKVQSNPDTVLQEMINANAALTADMVAIANGVIAVPPIVYWGKADTDLARFAVKNWTFNGAGDPAHPTFPYKVSYASVLSPNEAGPNWINPRPAQGNPRPGTEFNAHWITESGGILYDPSYGTAKILDPANGQDLDYNAANKAYEGAAFAGYFGEYAFTYEITYINGLPILTKKPEVLSVRIRQNDITHSSYSEVTIRYQNPDPSSTP